MTAAEEQANEEGNQDDPHQMKHSMCLFETIARKRGKHSVLIIGAIEESTNMTLAGDISTGKPHGLASDDHVSTQMHSRQ
jgi:hypothetical protein